MRSFLIMVLEEKKRRGRKPKTPAIAALPDPTTITRNLEDATTDRSVILHLKCRLSALCSSPQVVETIEGAGSSKDSFSECARATPAKSSDSRDKLQELAVSFRNNDASAKESACFWCTCPFSNDPVQIPRHWLDGSYVCYGCFCSPQCAAAYLFREHIDSASRTERYQLLNFIYNDASAGDAIRPAPDPHYLLDKFCGNLSITEFRERSLGRTSVVIVDKPLTRVLPELHEDTLDVVPRPRIDTNGPYRLRRGKSRPSKAAAVATAFGMASSSDCAKT